MNRIFLVLQGTIMMVCKRRRLIVNLLEMRKNLWYNLDKRIKNIIPLNIKEI